MHATPHTPQWALLVSVLVSHPLLTMASQLPVPAAHVTSHVPVLQSGAPGVGAQDIPQLLQSLAVTRFVSHPLVGLVSQSPQRGTHAKLHRLMPQVGLAFAAGGQAFPQPLQCCAFDRVSTQLPLHSVSPPPQTLWQDTPPARSV